MHASPSFVDLYGRPPDVTASAPGRVNLIGEHTDYNGGFVLPIATPQRTRVELAARDDQRVCLWSANVPGPVAAFALHGDGRMTLEVSSAPAAWLDYVVGCVGAVGARGVVGPGFDLRVESTVPLGSGLASSAALLVAVARGLSALWRLGLSGVDIAAVAHEAETRWVGAPVGVMDQMAASLAGQTQALFLDTRTRETETLPLPAGTCLLVINSGITHDNARGDYRMRRAECDEAAAMLGVPLLRDVTEVAALAVLPARLARRARHVVTENARVLAAREALRAGNAEAFGRLMNQSHDSMRDDFEVSVPAIDRLVAAAQHQAGVLGARLTGGGFGGSMVALVRGGDAAACGARVLAACPEVTGATVLVA